MSNATASYDSPIRNQAAQSPYTLASGGVVYAGTFAQVDTTGAYVAAGSGAATRKVVGQFVHDSGTVAADTLVPVREGDILVNNSVSDAVVVGDVGASVYVEDDHTVCHTSTSKAKAGTFIGFDQVNTSLCWVRCTLATT